MNDKTEQFYEFPPGPESIELIKLLKYFPYRQRRGYFKRRFNNVKRYLYKYSSFIHNDERSLHYAKTILVNSNLWLSSPLDFNDPFDCRIHFLTDTSSGTRKKRFDELANLTKQSGDQPLDEEAVNSAVDYVAKELAAMILQNMGVTCFSENPRNLLMWSHYAKHHTGICYQFEVARDFDIFPRAVSVKYTKKYPTNQLFEQSPGDAANAVLSKYEDWKYEKEMRITAPDGVHQLLRFRPKALTGIILGTCIDINTRTALYKMLEDRKKSGLPNLRIFQAVQHLSDYKLTLHKVQTLI